MLHIGNLANNAYVNAKIQRRYGVEADVACPDYYDRMASPAWEERDFHGHGVEQPEWFAQGRARTCQRYLLALRRRQRLRRELLRRLLRSERWLECRPTILAGILQTVFTASRRSLLYSRLAARKTTFPRSQSQADEFASDAIEARYRSYFPDRQTAFSVTDYADYAKAARAWKPVLNEYDLIQGYTLESIIPALAGFPHFAAYEHGTLREIPFEDSVRGRICAFAYREAHLVFITNTDVLPAAERLGIPRSRAVCLPHAVDSDRLSRFAGEHEQVRADAGVEVTFYSPTRHDWVDGDVSWSKGNDRFLRAAALLVGRESDFKLVLAEWGRDVEASKRLVADLNLGDRITWIPTLRKAELWTQYLRSHAVVDQFTVPAIGGVTFEAMALGRRVITAIDQAETERFFGETPAVLAASEPEEIAEAMQTVIADPSDEQCLGHAARDWFTRYHSAERIVELQAAAYRRLLE